MTDLNKFFVQISEDAKQMLDAHAVFLDKVSEKAADRLVDSFLEAVDSLKSMPERCPWYRGNYVPQYLYRYLLFENRYALIFQVEANTVFIDYVIDCRQDYSWLFR